MWTPWEPVTAEIEGDHLAPVIWRNRLYLFWVTFMERAPDQDASSGSTAGAQGLTRGMTTVSETHGEFFNSEITACPVGVDKEKGLAEVMLSQMKASLQSAVKNVLIDVQLHWSEYLHGEWTTRESGGFSRSKPVNRPFERSSVFIHVSKAYDGHEERGVFVHLGGQIKGSFFLAGRNSAPEMTGDYYANSPQGNTPTNPYYQPRANILSATRYLHSGPFNVNFTQRISTEPDKPPTLTTETLPILQNGDRYTLLPCDNNINLGAPVPLSLNADNPKAVEAAIKSGLPDIMSLMKPVFYQDNAHTLFIEPNVTERTVEEWQEWVTRTPQSGPARLNPDSLNEIAVAPQIPSHLDPGPVILINSESIMQVKPGQDWLANPGTGLLFEDELIGPGGRAEVKMLPFIDVANAITEGDMVVNVNPVGGLATNNNNVVVAGPVSSFEKTGLKQVAGGLNIVGAGGINSALAKNLGTVIPGGGVGGKNRGEEGGK